MKESFQERRKKSVVDLNNIINNTSNNNNISVDPIVKSSQRKQVEGEQKRQTELPMITS